jgi:hypothetical protein
MGEEVILQVTLVPRAAGAFRFLAEVSEATTKSSSDDASSSSPFILVRQSIQNNKRNACEIFRLSRPNASCDRYSNLTEI